MLFRSTVDTSTVPHIVATSFSTGQHYELVIQGYDELSGTDNVGNTDQYQTVEITGTIIPLTPPPRQEPNRGGSGHYYGPWGAEYIVPLDVSHLLGTHDPASMFGGDRSERPNATTARGKAIPVEEELSFLKSLPPPKVDTSMSFIKSLGQTTLTNDLKELSDLQQEVINESIGQSKVVDSPKLDIPVEELAETIQKTSKLLQMSAKSLLAGQANPNPETLSRMVSMIKECVTNLESKLPK